MKMKKKTLILKNICPGICLMIVLILTFSITSCNPKNQNTNTQNVAVAPTPCETELAGLKVTNKNLEDQNANLRVDTARLGEQVRCWESKFPNYSGDKNCDCVKRKIVVKKTTVRKSPIRTTQRVVATGSTPATKTIIVQSTRKLTDNLSYLRDQDGKIIFCCQANGREDLYFPDFAMQHGVVFTNFQNNLQKGYNFDVEPSPDYKGDYGVTDTGIFYISDALIRAALQKEAISLQYVCIKCPYTGWKNVRMDLDGDRWIYRTVAR